MKAQAAMEFLLTYGWAILIILVGLAGLFYIGVFDPDVPGRCALTPPLICGDVLVTEDGVTFSISAVGINYATVQDIKIDGKNCETDLGGLLINKDIPQNQPRSVSCINLDTPLSGKVLPEVIVEYQRPGGAVHKVSGSAQAETEPLIKMPPFEENFEFGFGSWVQETWDKFDLTRLTGATPTPNTGPSAAQQGTYYTYAEATGQVQNDNAVLTSPYFSGYEQVSFFYHMFGTVSPADPPQLKVHIEVNNVWNNNQFTVSGNQGDQWLSQQIDLTALATPTDRVRIRFAAVRGSDEDDIAIDNIQIT